MHPHRSGITTDRCANHRCTRNVAAYDRELKAADLLPARLLFRFLALTPGWLRFEGWESVAVDCGDSVVTQGSPQLPALFPCSCSKADGKQTSRAPSGKHLSPIFQTGRMILIGPPASRTISSSGTQSLGTEYLRIESNPQPTFAKARSAGTTGWTEPRPRPASSKPPADHSRSQQTTPQQNSPALGISRFWEKIDGNAGTHWPRGPLGPMGSMGIGCGCPEIESLRAVSCVRAVRI